MIRPLLSLFVLTIIGCAAEPLAPPANPTLLGQELKKHDAELIGQRFRIMLDFETDADAAFVRGAAEGYTPGHTGDRGRLISGPDASVNISSLLFGLTLPGEWTLLGAYVRPAAGGTVTTTLLADGRPIAVSARGVPAGAWAFAAVDLTADACRLALPTAKALALRIESPGGLTIDDVMLVDNRRTLARVDGGWSVTQTGLTLAVAWPGRPLLRVPSIAASPDGWAVVEANPIRVRLQDAASRPRWTLLADGRSVVDGRLTGAAGERAAFFQRPAQVAAGEATGRIDRESAGDADNDGFNEVRAAYQIIATGPRLHLRLTPRDGQTMDNPILEIRGLPPEASVVTANGKLMDQTARLSDGTLLVLMSLKIEAPIEITVGVSQP